MYVCAFMYIYMALHLYWSTCTEIHLYGRESYIFVNRRDVLPYLCRALLRKKPDVYIHMHMCVYMYTCVYESVIHRIALFMQSSFAKDSWCIHTYVYLCIFVCMYIYESVLQGIVLFMQSSFAKEAWCICTYVHVCMYVYIYAWECTTVYHPIYAEIFFWNMPAV